MSIDTLSKRTAVITGGATGLGAALARAAAAAGMRVVIADIDAGGAEAMSASLREGGAEAIAVTTDVCDQASVEALAERAWEAFGGVCLLINNAGVETLGYAWDVPAERWARTMAINVLGAIHTVRAFVPRMAAAGEQAFISNICSIGSILTIPVQSAYVTSKHALLAFSECLALDLQLAGYPIKASAVLPGPMQTDIFLKATGSAGGGEHHRQMMQQRVMTEGITADAAAHIILPAIAAGDFWITSHPEQFMGQMKRRGEMLAAMEKPQLGRGIFGLPEAHSHGEAV